MPAAPAPASPLLVTLTLADLAAAIRAEVSAALDARDHAPASDYLDAAGVAAFLSVHPRSVQKMARHQGLPVVRLGKLLRYRRSEVETWLRDRRR